MTLQRITKRQAIQRFNRDLPIILCPHKMTPSGLWDQGYHLGSVVIQEWRERASWYAQGRTDSPCWKGDINRTAWDLMYSNWAYCSASYETGYYAHYYIATES
jgi:hypothetical protein